MHTKIALDVRTYRTNRPPEEDGSGRLSSTDSSRPSSDMLPLKDEGGDEDENEEKMKMKMKMKMEM